MSLYMSIHYNFLQSLFSKIEFLIQYEHELNTIYNRAYKINFN
jgi:hypothetical protein